MTKATPFIWRDEYSVGVADMDNEHKALFRTAEELSQAVAKNNSADIQAIFARFLAYAKFHFEDEEAAMRQHGFPEYAAHVSEHLRLKIQLNQLDATIRLGMDGINDRALEFIESWLVDHLCGSDRRFAQYVRQREADRLAI